MASFETESPTGFYKTDVGLIRTQGALILNEEIDRIVQFAVKQWPAQIDASIEEEVASESQGEDGGAGGDAADARRIQPRLADD